MKKAISIGELLVTMAIIGIIAMLVLPGFMKDYHKKIYTAKLKKTMELVEAAVNQACIDNNVSYFYQTEYIASNDKIKEFLDKYFKTVSKGNNVFYSKNYLSITSTNSSTLNPTNAVKLSSGEALSFECADNLCTVRVDVNSSDGPNRGGRDLFTLYLDAKTNLFNSATPLNTDGDLTDTCKSSVVGDGCYYVLLKNNWIMDY